MEVDRALLETVNQLLTTILLLAAIMLTGMAIVLLRKLGKQEGGKPETTTGRLPQGREYTPSPREAQEAPKPPNEPLEEDTPAPEEYSWILQLGKRKHRRNSSKQ